MMIRSVKGTAILGCVIGSCLLWLAIGMRDCSAQTPDGFLGDGGVLTQAEVEEGWIALFDGETLFGWRPQPQAAFRVDDRTIVVDGGKKCLLCTTTQFSDFVFKAEFRCDRDTNSGIFLRTSPKPRNVTQACFELNIAPADNPFPTGSFVGRKKYAGHAPDEQWHQYEVTMLGGAVTVRLDGEEVLKYDDPNAVGRGFIGLQHNSGKVAFRNVKLKPLAMQSLFNGKDLTGWRQYPDMKSSFAVNEQGELQMQNGKGQLESEGRYADFVFQMKAISHGQHLNSGVFFRCIPGEEMNGYESQIQNGFVDGDRTKPMDAGTGAIFRRKHARRVAADDFAWFSKTIVAEGPHIATWVNGYLVTDWVDRRKPDKNPRRGLRIEAGSIMLQGHDPTTDFSFRDISIAEMPKR